MFRKSILALSLAIISQASISAPIANLKVSGDIKPPTCMINGNNETELLYSFGNVSPSVIPQDTTYNGLPKLTNSLNVVCDAETYLTFKAIDNYPNKFIYLPGQNINFDGITFNLVDASDTTKNIGGISFSYSNVIVDGKPAFLSRANDGIRDNGTWSGPTGIVKNATTGWTKIQQQSVAIASLDLISGKEFSADIHNRSTMYQGMNLTYLFPKAELAKNGIDITDGLDYVGQAILTFNFGI